MAQTSLEIAARNGHEAIVQRLLRNDQGNVNAKDIYGRTPLLWAAGRGYGGIVKLLLANNRVNVNAKDIYGRTPLLWAAGRGHEGIVQLLLANDRVNVNARDIYGRTPLSWAAGRRHEEIVQVLLANDRVNVNAKDFYGRTPLLWATKNGHDAVAKLLSNCQRRKIRPEIPIYLILAWHKICHLIFLSSRLQMALQIDLCLGSLSEFPNRLRPPCTTMPWNIRSALAVLWGVCWMFYSPQTTPQPDQSHTIWNIEPLDINLGIPYEPNQFQHISSFDQQLDLLQGISENSSQLTLDFDPFARLGTPDAWSDLLLEGRGDFKQLETSDIYAFHASESSEQTSIPSPTRATDTMQNNLSGSETFTSIAQVDLNNPLQLSMAVSDQHLTQSDLITTLPAAETADNKTLPTVPIAQTSIHINQPMEPPRNSKGSIICDRVECSNTIFRTRSAWRIHMDRHNRPYKCEVADCLQTNGFGSKGELKRHVNSVHKQLNLPCPITGCSYSCTRKDNLQDHVNRQHRGRIPERPATLQGCLDSSAVEEGILNSDSSRQASSMNQVDMTVRGTRKRRRLLEGNLSLENADSTNEELDGLQEENKRLRREIGALERELELSKKGEETLFEVIRKYTG